jgi:hypothetical protein
MSWLSFAIGVGAGLGLAAVAVWIVLWRATRGWFPMRGPKP